MSIRLHVEVIGSGPVLCLHHGFGGSARNFRPQVRAFKETRTVVTFDARGHARSEAPAGDDAYTIDAFVDDIGDALQRTGRDIAVLGGLSMGAALALEFALRNPARVSALVLASFPRVGTAQHWALPFAEAIERDGLEVAGSRFVWGGDRFDPAAAGLIRKGFLEHSAPALASTLKHVLAGLTATAPSRERCRTLNIPILLIAGVHDAPSLEASEPLAEIFPRATLVRLEAGHVVNLEAPAEFNAAVAKFLSDSAV